MQVIDAHVHFWEIAQNNQPWLAHPEPNLLGDYSPMAKDFGPRELLAGCGDIDILGAVHIEADAVDPLKETRWLSQVVGHTDLPLALVIGADLSRPDAAETLERQLALSDRVRGVRQILNVHADPLYDYVGRHFMQESRWRQNFGLLAQHGLSFDLQLYPSQMAQAARLAAEHAETLFLLNHAGMYVDRHGVEGWREWRDGLRLLAARDNVCLKLSGFGMLDHCWTEDSLRPLILEGIDAFGVARCLFASNFPVDGLYTDYGRLWRTYASIVGDASVDERRALFVDNARRLYRL
ncbi:amidohydrolase family protein [Salinicola peritrichatus]|uniref:amidohydrolase family protein n=1 Tax=Salinicola peritrichatus TaxID=1267424 RepID=UPI000DA17E03|nr:amidohydrolase family protein [Salinicola peritrichatus]